MADLSKIEAWLQREDDELLYEPDKDADFIRFRNGSAIYFHRMEEVTEAYIPYDAALTRDLWNDLMNTAIDRSYGVWVASE